MDYDIALISSLSSFALGILFGVLAQSSNFCFLNAIKSFVYKKRDSFPTSVLLAMATALVSSQILSYALDLNLESSIYLDLTPSFPVLILGSLLFSLGMVLANGCPNRHLVLMGNGNMRSILVIIVMGISSYITVRGLFAEPRIFLEALTVIEMPASSVDGFIAFGTGLDATYTKLVTCLGMAALLLFFAWKCRPDENNYFDYFAAFIIGLTVGLGWLITGYIGFDEFDPLPLQSLAFTVPPGEALVYLMTFTGSTISFSIALVFGVLLGSLLSSLFTRKFHWRGFESTHQMQRSLIGATLMGVGAVMSLGCAVGQGLSGFSTLSFSSLLVVLSIFISSWFIIKLRG